MKMVVVGELFKKNSFCPQCRKRVPKENRRKNGIKCPRCGFFKWEDYKKYKQFIDVPEPTKVETIEAEKFIEEKLGEEIETEEEVEEEVEEEEQYQYIKECKKCHKEFGTDIPQRRICNDCK